MLWCYWLAGLSILPSVPLGGLAQTDQKQAEAEPLAVIRKEMAEHPLDALAIARRATQNFKQEEKHFYALAAQLQEKNLHQLSFGQVLELVDVVESKLQDLPTSMRIRVSWLQQRGNNLLPQEVRQILGSPRHVSSQILFRRQIEQWNYDLPISVSLTFSCTEGHDIRLQAVHSAKP